MVDVRRREFIALLGGTAAWPVMAGAQQPAMPVIGFVRSGTIADVPHFVTAFRQGLKKAGFVEGQNATMELYSGDNNPGRLSALIVGLVRRPVAVIVGNNDTAHAAKAETTTIPIVFATGSDPVRDGLVAGLNRPGGNITGAVFFAGAYRLVGGYTGRVLNGEKPENLPVQQVTKVELVINLKTAKALGLEVPPTVLARADEVIE
jgi:putative ABC transport system substrate-binding protein